MSSMQDLFFGGTINTVLSKPDKPKDREHSAWQSHGPAVNQLSNTGHAWTAYRAKETPNRWRALQLPRYALATEIEPVLKTGCALHTWSSRWDCEDSQISHRSMARGEHTPSATGKLPLVAFLCGHFAARSTMM